MSTTATPTRAHISRKTASSLAETLSVTHSPVRVEMIFRLAEQPRNVTELCELLAMPQPGVSHHLALLRVSGIVEDGRRMKFNVYTLTSRGRALHDALAGFLAAEEAIP